MWRVDCLVGLDRAHGVALGIHDVLGVHGIGVVGSHLLGSD